MKRILAVLFALSIVRPAIFAAEGEKVLKNVDGNRNVLLEKLGAEEGAKVAKQVVAQYQAYLAAKGKEDFEEAARITPFGHVEAHMLNTAAYRLILKYEEGANTAAAGLSGKEASKARDAYAKTADVVTLLNKIVDLEETAEEASKAARASDYVTKDLTRDAIVSSLDLVDGYIAKNKAYAECQLDSSTCPKK
jgi:hypothetical protein